MPVVADASVAIRGDMSGFHRDLKGAETATVGFRGKLSSLLSPKNLIGAAGVFGIGLGVTQAVRQIQDVIGEYSELKQAQRTVDDVFGESASVIEDWADRAADAAGLSKREVSLSASTMGTMLQNMGVDAGDAADMVVTLQQRAADLATAFPGKSAADAMVAFSAALRGERDTVEKFGVTLTQAMIDARIETMNLDTSTPAAERYATAIATLGLIMDQTAGSAGRFEDALEEGDPTAMAESLGARIENANAGLAANVEELLRSVSDPAIHIAKTVNTFFDDVFNPEKQRKLQFLADELGITFNDARDLVKAGAEDAGQSWSDTLDSMVDDLIHTKAETDQGMWEVMQGIYSQAVAGTERVREQARVMAGVIPDEIERRWTDTRDAAFQMAVEHAKGILDGQNQVKVAFEVLTQLQEEEQTKAQRISYLMGKLSSEELRDGLNDGRPGVRGAASALRAQIVAELATLGVNAYNSGYSVGKNVAAGIYASAHLADGASSYLAAKISGYLPRSEPKEGPLRGITKVGDAIVHSITDGIYSNIGSADAAAGALAGALVPSLGSSAAGMSGGMGMGQTINNYLMVEGVPKRLRDADEMWGAFETMTDRSIVK